MKSNISHNLSGDQQMKAKSFSIQNDSKLSSFAKKNTLIKIENETVGLSNLEENEKSRWDREKTLTERENNNMSADTQNQEMEDMSISQEKPKPTVNYTKDEVKSNLSKIFFNFAKYYKEEKESLISHQAMLRLMKKINILDEISFKSSDFDLIIRKVNPHSNKLNEKQFLDFIIKLVAKLYPQDYKNNPRECVNYFVFNFLQPYANSLDKNTLNTQESVKESKFFNTINLNIENLIANPVDSQLSAIVYNVFYAVKEIYLHYFHYEINSYRDRKKIEEASLESLCEFCKDFQILPYLISMDKLVNYYTLTLQYEPQQRDEGNFEEKNLGVCFTLRKFSAMFIHLSQISYTKSNVLGFNKSTSDVDKLLLFLEKLENSKGFQNLERLTSKPHSSKLTLIPSKSILGMLNSNLFNFELRDIRDSYVNLDVRFQRHENAIDTKVIKEFNGQLKSNGDFNLRSLMTVNQEVFTYIENDIKFYREVFLHYAKMGDKLNFNRMNMSSFLRFIKDCDIFYQIPKEKKKNFYTAENTRLHYDSRAFSQSPKKQNELFSKVSTKSLLSYKKTVNKMVNVSDMGGRLTESDIDIIFTMLTGPKNFENSKFKLDQENFGNTSQTVVIDKQNIMKSSTSGVQQRLDFFLFIKSFELIATKLFPKMNVNQAVLEFLNKKLIKKLREQVKRGNSMGEIIEKINRPEIRSFILELEPPMLNFYLNYSNQQQLMTFEHFFDFYKDFSLFPDIINLIQIKKLFSTLAEVYANAEIEDLSQSKSFVSIDKDALNVGKASNNIINFNLFLQSLVLASMSLKLGDNFKEIDKCIYLLERINQSKGIQKCQMRNSTNFNSSRELVAFIQKVNTKYPEFCNFINEKNAVLPTSFDEVYNKAEQ